MNRKVARALLTLTIVFVFFGGLGQRETAKALDCYQSLSYYPIDHSQSLSNNICLRWGTGLAYSIEATTTAFDANHSPVAVYWVNVYAVGYDACDGGPSIQWATPQGSYETNSTSVATYSGGYQATCSVYHTYTEYSGHGRYYSSSESLQWTCAYTYQ